MIEMMFRLVFVAARTVSIFRPETPDLSIRYFLIRFKRVAAEAAVLLFAVISDITTVLKPWDLIIALILLKVEISTAESFVLEFFTN